MLLKECCTRDQFSTDTKLPVGRRCNLGKIDIISKQYLSNPVFFADAFNFHLYGGRQVIQPDELKEMDTLELAAPYGKDSWVPEQRFRDVMKQWTVKSGPDAVYALLGCEAQTYVDYAMPVRSMLMDAMTYGKQVRAAASSYRAAGGKAADLNLIMKDGKINAVPLISGGKNKAFLSGFKKEDRLVPVITLVLFFDPSVWDGPRSIHEMFAPQNKAILEYVPDYKFKSRSRDLARDSGQRQLTSSKPNPCASLRSVYLSVRLLTLR